MTFENRFVRQPQNELLYTFHISIGSLKTQELTLFYAINITLSFKVVTHKNKVTEFTDRTVENNCANRKVRSLSGTSDPPGACLLSHVTTRNQSRKQTDIHHLNIGKKGLRIQQE